MLLPNRTSQSVKEGTSILALFVSSYNKKKKEKTRTQLFGEKSNLNLIILFLLTCERHLYIYVNKLN